MKSQAQKKQDCKISEKDSVKTQMSVGAQMVKKMIECYVKSKETEQIDIDH